jgi:hypothetical protein
MNCGDGSKVEGVRTLTVPVVPHPAAMSSPQYLSLHQEMHHPPSASRFPSPGRAGCGVLDDDNVVLALEDCCSACATRDAEAAAGSKVPWAWVGVATAMVWTRERRDGEAAVGIARTSSSSAGCHVVRDGCSRHS